jgi:nicotinamidase-related amidase
VGIDCTDFSTEHQGEKIVEKSTFDAFLNTELGTRSCTLPNRSFNADSYLRARGKQTIFVAGLLTSACVLCSALGAFFRLSTRLRSLTHAVAIACIALKIVVAIEQLKSTISS